MNDELGQELDPTVETGAEELDEETMQLIAQLLQEGFTEDEIVEAILKAEEEGDEGGDLLEEPPAEEPEEEKKSDEFAKGGFAGKEKKDPAPVKKKDPPAKKPPAKKPEVSDIRLKKPTNNLASIIGSLGRFN
jgi:hypothetical protein